MFGDSVTNLDIFLKNKKIQLLTEIVDKMTGNYTEICKYIRLLDTYNKQYVKQCELLDQAVEKIENDSVFSSQEIKEFEKSVDKYTRDHLVQDYLKLDKKYTQLSQTINMIDKQYYKDILEAVLEDAF